MAGVKTKWIRGSIYGKKLGYKRVNQILLMTVGEEFFMIPFDDAKKRKNEWAFNTQLFFAKGCSFPYDMQDNQNVFLCHNEERQKVIHIDIREKGEYLTVNVDEGAWVLAMSKKDVFEFLKLEKPWYAK